MLLSVIFLKVVVNRGKQFSQYICQWPDYVGLAVTNKILLVISSICWTDKRLWALMVTCGSLMVTYSEQKQVRVNTIFSPFSDFAILINTCYRTWAHDRNGKKVAAKLATKVAATRKVSAFLHVTSEPPYLLVLLFLKSKSPGTKAI